MEKQTENTRPECPKAFYFVSIPGDFGQTPFASSLMYGSTALAAVYQVKGAIRVVSEHFDLRFADNVFTPAGVTQAEWLGKLITETFGFRLELFL
ncbi:ssDNA binding protein [Enterobacteria phage PRDmagenta]